jgi:hypothetical protein
MNKGGEEVLSMTNVFGAYYLWECLSKDLNAAIKKNLYHLWTPVDKFSFEWIYSPSPL